MPAPDVPDDLQLQLGGLLSGDEPFHRRTLLEIEESRAPFAPDSRLWVYLSELRGGEDSGWHVHHGPVFHVILQGKVRVETEVAGREFTAGDSFTEAVGEVHRAVNLDPEVPIVSLSFQVTGAGTEAVTVVDAGDRAI